MVESVYESFRSESLSQLWLHRLYLVDRYPEVDHAKTITGYDDGCHWWSFVTNPKRSQVSKAAQILAQQDVIIDNMHLRGHKDPSCKELFNPKNHPIAKFLNTQVAEQTFSWFHLFKHIGRNMNQERYWIFVFGMFHERNKVTIRRRTSCRHQMKRALPSLDSNAPTNSLSRNSPAVNSVSRIKKSKKDML